MARDYDQQAARARQRLRAALGPAMADEHRVVDWLLSNLIPSEMDVWSEMVERRRRTARRSAQIHVAQHALAHWMPGPGAPADAYATMEHWASGADVRSDPAVDQLAADQHEGDERRGDAH